MLAARGQGKKKWMVLVLAVLMVVAAGCQAVGGLDLNGVLKNALKVQSMEGKQSIGFQLMLKQDALKDMGPEEAAMASLLSKAKLELTDIKMKDANTASYKGSLSLGDTRIGFSLRTAGSLTVLQVDGLAKPLELDLTADALNGLLSGGLGGFSQEDLFGSELPEGGTEDVQAQVKKLVDSLVDVVGGYAIDNLPNPSRLTVAPVTETVGGESLQLMKVHADINGAELWKWAGDYLAALIADKDGLKEMLTGVIELLVQQEPLWKSLGEDNPFEEIPQGAERDEFVQEGVDAVIDALAELQKEYTKVKQEDVQAFFNDNTYIKADLYADAKLHIRKQSLEFGLKSMASGEAAGGSSEEEIGEDYDFEDSAAGIVDSFLDGIVITYDSESWNINGTVTPDAPVKTAGAITVEQLESMQGYHFLRQTDRSSVLYDLLQNKLHIGKQEIELYPDYGYYAPIVTPDGRTLVPLRYVADQLGASVVLNPDKTIRVYDEGSYAGIDMRLGSAEVSVNGVKTKWSYPVTRLSNGMTYVPAKDLAKALGCKIGWEPVYEGSASKFFVISREVA